MEPWTILLLLVTVIGLLMVFAGSRGQERARQTARLAAIERKLDAVMAHLGIAEPTPDTPDVIQQLQMGNKIQAIKLYRRHTGIGLADAKAAVEQIARERGLDR